MIALLLALLLAVPVPKVRVHEQVGKAPYTLNATIRIEPHYEDVELCVFVLPIEENGFERASCWSLDGQYGWRTHFFQLRGIPEGKYKVMARLVRVREAVDSPFINLIVNEANPSNEWSTN